MRRQISVAICFILTQTLSLAQQPPSVPSGPAAATVPAAVSPVGADEIDSIDLTPPSAQPENVNQPSAIKTQACDPTLDEKLYWNLFALSCAKARTAECPSTSSQELKHWSSELTALALGGSMTSTYMLGQYMEQTLVMNGANRVSNALAVKDVHDMVAKLVGSGKLDAAAADVLSKALEDGSTKALKRALDTVARSNLTTDTMKIVANALMTLPRSRISWLALASALSTGVLTAFLTKLSVAASVASDAKPTGCETIESPYISEDPANRCEPRYVIDSAVIDFLKLDHATKQEKLQKIPQVCNYYQKFNAMLEEKLKPNRTTKNIRCDGKNALSYDVQVFPGGEQTGHPMHVTMAYQDDGTPKKMDVAAEKPGTNDPRSFSVGYSLNDGAYQIQSISYPYSGPNSSTMMTEGYDKFFSSSFLTLGWRKTYQPVISETIFWNKFIGRSAHLCCQIDSETERAKCLNGITTIDHTSADHDHFGHDTSVR